MAKAEEMGIKKPGSKKKSLYENHTSSSVNIKDNSNSEHNGKKNSSEELKNEDEKIDKSQSEQSLEDLSPHQKKFSSSLEYDEEIEQVVANLNLGTNTSVY